MSRHMFPGGNTPNGFFSYFEQVLPVEEARRIIFLKGASGSGKSTFIRRVGAEFELLGDAVEYMHCSNDTESLDGVFIRNKGLCILDGTAPHIGDPKIPVAVDEIINLAEYIDESKILPHKEELKSLQRIKKVFIETAYGYYAAAYSIFKNNKAIYDGAVIKSKINKVADGILEMLMAMPAGKDNGVNRKLFASAISPQGNISFVDKVINTSKIYEFSGTTGTDCVLDAIQKYSNIRGYNTESFYCPLNPQKLEHLIIPALDISFVTLNKHHKFKLKPNEKINFDTFIDSSKIERFNEEINFNDKMFDELLQKAIDTLKKAKDVHEGIENIYCRHMDFKGLDAICDKTIDRLKRMSL